MSAQSGAYIIDNFIALIIIILIKPMDNTNKITNKIYLYLPAINKLNVGVQECPRVIDICGKSKIIAARKCSTTPTPSTVVKNLKRDQNVDNNCYNIIAYFDC